MRAHRESPHHHQERRASACRVVERRDLSGLGRLTPAALLTAGGLLTESLHIVEGIRSLVLRGESHQEVGHDQRRVS